MVKFIKRIISRIRLERRKLLDKKKINISTSKGRYVIHTTHGHPLKSYLKKMRLYDRFLPFLIRNTNSGIIDIGANIGDTMTLIKSITDTDILCVEPDTEFIKLLEKNILINKFNNVIIYPFAISNLKKSIILKKNSLNNTASIEENFYSNDINTKTFTDLIEDLNINLSNFNTIKIDTDGYDWDCLESIYDYCRNNSHYFNYIFYEHQTYLNNAGPYDSERGYREEKYIKILYKLRDIGFNNYFLFDNFGTFLFHTTDINILSNINEYIKRTRIENNHSTIHFIDVLICNDKNVDLVYKSIKEYVNCTIVVY